MAEQTHEERIAERKAELAEGKKGTKKTKAKGKK